MRYLIDVIYLVAMLTMVLAVAGGTRLITTDKVLTGWRNRMVASKGEDSTIGYMLHCDRCISHHVATLILAETLAFGALWLHGQRFWAVAVASPALILAIAYASYRLLNTEN